MQQFVAEPVVASRVVESNFKLRPRTVEEVDSVDILLDQQRNTKYGYTTNNRIRRITRIIQSGPKSDCCPAVL